MAATDGNGCRRSMDSVLVGRLLFGECDGSAGIGGLSTHACDQPRGRHCQCTGGIYPAGHRHRHYRPYDPPSLSAFPSVGTTEPSELARLPPQNGMHVAPTAPVEGAPPAICKSD